MDAVLTSLAKHDIGFAATVCDEFRFLDQAGDKVGKAMNQGALISAIEGLGTIERSIGPPGTTTAGRSTDDAAMRREGMVLSQPPSSTTPSIGLARSISSIDIAARLRHSIAVGFTCVSPSDITGSSSGTPPASQMPCFTDCATSVRCALHGVRCAGRYRHDLEA